ncbi:hypothetical protein NEOLEDRAFT_1137278 [Neolentinus lepideus HHB14362 ss-1]|uniref:Fungal pheromone STE3G-protein-coupled receptor n=1 Tax=Neolentinus lepideus HHB14362 ss-1 TaxID=1314782 RepID=A0A165QVE0_9AGAM|nr:hypothetical protein NEOLEDRAFT_1137278 [Neolentinus lepideus HHB14362 ss-1]
MKILYLINRYFGLAVVVSNTALAWLQTAGHISCNSFRLFVSTAITILILVVQMILQVRARAILGNQQAHVNAITLLFIVEIGFVIGLSVRYSNAVKTTFLRIEFCDTRLSLSLVPAIIFDAIMAFIIIYKAVVHTIQRRHMDIPASWGYGGRLLVTLARDSLKYYICIIFVFTVVVLRDFMSSDSFNVESSFLFPWVAVVPTASSTSMILHLHEAASAGEIPTSVGQMSTVIELVEIPSNTQAVNGPLRQEQTRKTRLHFSWLPTDLIHFSFQLPGSPTLSHLRCDEEETREEHPENLPTKLRRECKM